MNRDCAINELATQLLTANMGVHVPGLGVFYKKRDPVQRASSNRRLEPPQFRWYLNRGAAVTTANTQVSQWEFSSSLLLDEVPTDWTESFDLLGLGRIVPTGVGEGRLEPEHPLLVHFLASYRYPAIVPPTRMLFPNGLNGPSVPDEINRKGIWKRRMGMIGWAALWIAVLGPAVLLFRQYGLSDETQRAGLSEVRVRHDSSLLPEFPRLYPPMDSTIMEYEAGTISQADTFQRETDSLPSMSLAPTIDSNALPVQGKVSPDYPGSTYRIPRQPEAVTRIPRQPEAVARIPRQPEIAAPNYSSLELESHISEATFDAVVVVGCFSSKRNAERQELALKQSGFEPAVISPSAGGLKRVGTVFSVRSAAEADSFLTLIRAKIQHDAWLLEKYPSGR
ncbi:MAG: hypothetical protein FJ344_00330 [Sphingomonadales bacterium]|nr:hypothetical protein [Sphingomonadales bacterium]